MRSVSDRSCRANKTGTECAITLEVNEKVKQSHRPGVAQKVPGN